MRSGWLVFGVHLAIFALTWSSGAQHALADVSWRLDSRFRYGLRVGEPMGLATLQHQAAMLSEGPIGDSWSFQLGARIRGDGAYTVAKHHFAELEKQDPPEVLLREANLEYRTGDWILRIGSQVFTWGEAFGSFFADVVNPKDFREAGFGEIRDLSDPVEAVNLIYAQSEWSLQAVYLPFYRANKLPYPSSDFFPLALADRFRGMTIDFDQSENPTGPKGRFHMLNPLCHAIFAHTQDKQAAKAFLRWLMAPKQAGAWYEVAVSYYQPFLHAYDDAPFWKVEDTPGGEQWVGAHEGDDQAAKKWER